MLYGINARWHRRGDEKVRNSTEMLSSKNIIQKQKKGKIIYYSSFNIKVITDNEIKNLKRRLDNHRLKIEELLRRVDTSESKTSPPAG